MSTGLLFCGTGHLIFKVVAQHLPAFLRLKRLEVKTGFMWFQLKALNLKHHNFLVLFSEVFCCQKLKNCSSKVLNSTPLYRVSPQIQVNQNPKLATSPTNIRQDQRDGPPQSPRCLPKINDDSISMPVFFEDLTLKLLKYDDVTVTDVMILSWSGRKRQNCFIFFPLALSSWGWSGWGDEPETDEIENLDSDLAWS